LLLVAGRFAAIITFSKQFLDIPVIFMWHTAQLKIQQSATTRVREALG